MENSTKGVVSNSKLTIEEVDLITHVLSALREQLGELTRNQVKEEMIARNPGLSFLNTLGKSIYETDPERGERFRELMDKRFDHEIDMKMEEINKDMKIYQSILIKLSLLKSEQ